jgi:hypothetical protein
MSELWGLVWGKPEVDPTALAKAIENELNTGQLDFRTRVLIRDSTEALEQFWGVQRLQEWLSGSPVRDKIESIRQEDLGKPGFPALRGQLVDRTEPDTVREFLRELGSRIDQPVVLSIGGSIALILTEYLSRATTDLDIVDEVPESIRKNRPLLDELQKRYGLMLTHFQSHYLPSGWQGRMRDLGSFGRIQVCTVDVYDVFLGKLFSKRAKDLDDLRALKERLDKHVLTERLSTTTVALQQDKAGQAAAKQNWYVLFGENMPESCS